jgi:hypothetical protein
MRSKHLAAAAALVLVIAPVGASAQTAERRTLSGRDVAIYNLAGVLKVEGGSGSDVVVEITRRGADASQLRIETGEIRNRQTLRVIYPDRRIHWEGSRTGGGWWGSSRTTVSVADDGTFGDNGDHGLFGRGHRVEISSRDGLEASADLRVIVPEGKRLAVHLAVGEATVSNVNGDLVVDVHAASVTTTGTKGRLSLDTGAGDVRVTDAEGDVDLDSGSGGVTLERVRGARLRLDSGSGRVRGAEIAVDDLDVDSGSGSVDLRAVRADAIIIDSGSGSVGLDLRANVRSLRVDAGSGSVTITAPPNLDAELVAETGSGGIDIDFPITLRKRERGYLAGRIGEGKGRITIDSGSGEVVIRKGSAER